MACYSPLPGFRGEVNENGKRPVVWRAPAGTEKQSIPCGKCVGCRLRYAKGMAIRCMHESQCHDSNTFITLTFDKEHLPEDNSLDVRHVQLFMKKLREYLSYPACRLSDRKEFFVRTKVRYFFAGEYGGDRGRPHYHGLLFGYDFPDKVLVDQFRSSTGKKFYKSDELSKLWPQGFHSIADVNFATVSYVARYCLKKVSGEDSDEHYVDKSTGVMRKPEFTVMSRRPGIGSIWFDKYGCDVFPSDEVVFAGKSDRPPRYYDYLFDKKNPDLLESLKLKRFSKVVWSESTGDRLLVKEEVKLAQLKSFKRNLKEAD